jgi:hypothetical protein
MIDGRSLGEYVAGQIALRILIVAVVVGVAAFALGAWLF